LDEWLAYLLAGEAPMEAIMNMPSHGLSEAELIEHFFRLWNAGLIECSEEESGPPVSPEFELARQQFEHSGAWPPTGNRALLYRLTKEWAKLWEYLSSPDSNKFLLRSTGSHAKQFTVTLANRRLVELEQICGWGLPPPISGTEKWEALGAWRPTYWKTLPTGHRLPFEFESWDKPSRIPKSEEDYERISHQLKSLPQTGGHGAKGLKRFAEHFS
jgi:hypothetical protein